MIQHFDITVSGRVQDVGFRYHTQRAAERLGIAGTVRNQPDGSVRIEAEADEEQLREFLNWCQTGPGAANVNSLHHHPGELRNYARFEIIK